MHRPSFKHRRDLPSPWDRRVWPLHFLSPEPSDISAFGTDTQISVHPFPVRVADRAVAFVQNPPHTEVNFSGCV